MIFRWGTPLIVEKWRRRVFLTYFHSCYIIGNVKRVGNMCILATLKATKCYIVILYIYDTIWSPVMNSIHAV